MNVRYRLTDKEFVQACRARSPLGAWTLPVAGACLELVAAVQIALKVSPLSAALAVGVLGGIFMCIPLLNKLSFKRSPQYGKEIEVQIGESGVTFNVSSVSAQCAWDAFREFKETDNLFLLYHTPTALNALPKRAFNDEDMGRFRALASQKITSCLPQDRWRTFVFIAVMVLTFVLLLQVLHHS